MKKKIFFTLIIIVCAVVLYGQKLPYKEVEFKNLNPVWLHSPIDSSLIGDGDYTGRNHFYNVTDIPYPYIISGNYLYIAYHTQYSSGEVEGALLEKINLEDGKVMWQQKWDLRNNDRQEWVESIYIGDQGYLNVVTDKRIRAPFNDIYDLFTFRGDTCLINIRKFNIEDGSLVENTGGSIDDQESLRIKNIPAKTVLFPEDNNYQYYDMSNSYEYLSLYNIDEYGHVISDVLIDTIKFEGDVDIHDDEVYFYRRIYKVNRDTLISLNILSNKKKFGTDTQINVIDTQTIVTILNKKMKVTKEFRIDTLLPYRYKKLYLNYADDNYLMIYGQKLNKSYRDTFFYVLFNYEGEKVRQFTGVYKNKNHFFYSIQYLEDEKEFLLSTYSSHYYGLDFVLTTLYDSVTQIKEFYYEDKRYGFFPFFIKQLENKDIFLFGNTSYFDEDLSRFIGKWPTMMRIKAEDLGLKGTATRNILTNTNNISISPNPAQSTISLDFEEKLSGDIVIVDALGREVLRTKIRIVSKQVVDVSGLIPGIYFVKVLDRKNHYVYKAGRFVKE